MGDRGGKVYFVGAGPGAAAYLTLRAQHLLQQAEVLVYDALVDRTLLSLLPPTCAQWAVGKRGGQPSTPQAAINTLLVEQVAQGRQVVRLKSGDPFIYGRTTSEIQAVQAAGYDFECVPGISAALSAPLLAGIPLTDPVLSRSFAVTTGHDPAEVDWATLAQIETLVILMGTRTLAQIVAALSRHGVPGDRPVAVIQWAGQPQQRVWVSTVARVVADTAGDRLSPSVIVIGAVVGLRDYLQPALPASAHPPRPTSTASPVPASAPLSSMTSARSTSPSTHSPQGPLAEVTVLVTRAAEQSSTFRDLLSDRGATVLELPTLIITPPSSWAELDQAIAQLQHFDWLILTSANGVRYLWERLLQQGGDGRSLAGLKIAVVGQKTAQSLTAKGIQPDYIPPDFVADALVATFPVTDLRHTRILFPRVESGGRDILVREFRAQGAQVVEVPAYESRCPTDLDPAIAQALAQGRVDVLTFASSKTVQNFCTLVEATPGLSLQDEWLRSLYIASIGPQTSATCQALLGRVDMEAAEYTLAGLTDVITEWYSGGRSR